MTYACPASWRAGRPLMVTPEFSQKGRRRIP
ncbi:MAG: hypothetical protein JO328_20465 [Hyphomicrobiales bacterium]|nr:hypothetical protein [Hyphomicrobiales bacterium]MBV8826995.1 hypothetical protein [Hyphomicrobiales bacterium]MBV9426966.1 hypothetical protein [Bradyrhizobiaceae bacterium]